MRIVIDMQGLQTPFSRNRGVGRYTIELVKAMTFNPMGHEIILALNGAFPDTIESIRAEFDAKLPQKNIKVWQQFFDASAINTKNIWRKEAGQILREEFLNSLKGDIIFSTNLQEGIFDAACTSVKILPTNSLICCTLHDVIPLIYPHKYLCDPVNRKWYMEKIDFIKKSDIVLTDSHASKKEICHLLEMPEQKVHVIYCAVNHDKFKSMNISVDDKKRLLYDMNISCPFVMYVGGSDRHKNLDTLYSAFSKLPKQILASHQLVMVGEGVKYKEDRYRRELSKMGINDRVVFTGQIDDDELIMLYNLCELFVCPSINEGFGLPPLEAMACGAAVLASDASSLPEVVGYQDALFDPYDDFGLAKKIERVLTDSGFKDLLIKHEMEQASKFSWKNSARSLLALFDEIVGKWKEVKLPSMRGDPIKNIIRHVASLSSSFEDNDLKMLSASLAESFCTRPHHRLFLDVSSIIKLDHLSGIQRVVLAICNELINNGQKVDVELVYTTTDDSEFYRANALIKKISGAERWFDKDDWIEFCSGDILLFLDLHPAVAISHKKKIQFLRNKGIFVYHVVYDLLPELMPEFFWSNLCIEFNEWLRAISYSDGAICISRSVAEELYEWLNSNAPKRIRPFKIGWFHLGADIKNAMPAWGLPDDAGPQLSKFAARPSFLMVGTIEPRKGHDQTLAAFEQLWKDGIDVNLVIVGRQGWIMEELLEKIKNHIESSNRLFWLQGISDEYLEKVYAVSTCLIAASEGEGFGLPLIEAAQHELPIIARSIPVFQEVAKEHAFYFNGKRAVDLAKAIREWLELYRSGRHPKSDGISFLTWKQSSQQLLSLILQNQWQYTFEDFGFC